jgi:homoserine kinase type II
MAVYTPLSTQDLADVAARFGLSPPERSLGEPKGSVNTNYHLWSGGERYFLRLNEGKSDADVEFEASALRYLEEAHFPAARLLLTTDGRPFVTLHERQAQLYRYSPGEELARDEVTPAHCRRLGEQLGRLHDLAAGFTGDRPNPYGPSRVKPWVDELEPDGGGDAAVARVLPMLREELERAQHLPSAPRGLVHGDLFIDNVLWIGDRISACLDWEMCGVDAFAYDLGVAVNAWCYHHAFEPERARALLAGYRARRRLDEDTRRALYAYTRYVALRYTASRIHAFHLADLGADRLARKDWNRYRERLSALREMGREGFDALMAE